MRGLQQALTSIQEGIKSSDGLFGSRQGDPEASTERAGVGE
jgi:hypothetical protein